MPNKFRQLFKMTVFFVVLFAGLFYLGGFSVAQSIALAFLFSMVWLFVVLRTEERLPFVPYQVFIRPKFRTIAADFDLLKDSDEEWAKLWKEIEKLPKEPWNIWESGFSFSVITPQLIFQHGWNRFTTELDMSASLEPLANPREGYEPFSPRLELHSLGIGYRLRLVLLEDHWNRIKSKPIFAKMDKLDAIFDRMCGTVEVVLALIPEEEVGVHFSVKRGDSGKAYTEAIKRRAEVRTRYGWKGEAQTDMYERETAPDNSNSVEHKYFEISHSSI